MFEISDPDKEPSNYQQPEQELSNTAACCKCKQQVQDHRVSTGKGSQH